ncbi:metal ABC transporter permease [Aquifex pyrophilus]
MQIIDVLLKALLLSLILLGIHSYLGFRVIRKGIIFADIAIAQWAALGIALSLLLNFHEISWLFSLLFSLIASFLIYLSERKRKLQEAFIGILYAAGASWIVILLSKNPSGREEFMNLIASDILFISEKELLFSAILYTIIGITFYIFRNSQLENLIFYLLFGITVSSSVKLVGVLVVFSLLLAPPLVSTILNKGLIFAWIYGSIINSSAVILSYLMDLPTGFTTVGLHTLTALLIFLLKVKF